jgi:CcmD family protein
MVRRLVAIARAAAPAVMLVAFSALVAAQGPSQDGFVPVSPSDAALQEQLPAKGLVFAAYAFVWVAMIAYVFSLWRRVTRVERELADVTSRLEAQRR